MRPHWFLVADAARARVLEQRTPGELPHVIETFANEEGRHPTHELVSDRPGRGHKASGAHTTFPQSTDPADVVKDRFARELAVYLEAAAQKHRFTTLSLLVPAPMLGRLRDRLPADLIAHIVHEVPTDLTNLADAELSGKLRDLRPHIPLEL